MHQKMDRLNQVFQANGFPETLIKETPPIISPRSLSNIQEDASKILCTSYIKGLSEKLRSVSLWE